MRIWLSTLPALWALSIASAALAQQTLSLKEALSLARSNNGDLQAARERLKGAEASVDLAYAAFLPTVNVQGKYTRNVPEVSFQPPAVMTPTGTVVPDRVLITPANQLDASATAIIPLVVPAAYPAYAAAKKSQRASEADLKVTETRLLFTTAQVFFAAAGTDELLLARQHAVEVADQTLKNAQARFEAGAATKVEISRAQLALVHAQQAHREAMAQQANVYDQLAALIRRPPGFRVAPAAEMDVALAVDAAQAEAALQLRPELDAFQLRLEALSANIDSQQYRWAPTLSAFGSARAFNYTGFAGRNTAFAVGVQLDWQIFDGGARDAQRHVIEAQLLDTKHQIGQLHRTVRNEVREAQRAIETKRAALAAAQEAVTLSNETLELVRVEYEAGTALQIDLLNAQDALVMAQVGVAQSRFDVALAELTLERVAGTFLSTYGDQAQ